MKMSANWGIRVNKDPKCGANFLGIFKAHILTKTVLGDDRGMPNYFWLIIFMKLI